MNRDEACDPSAETSAPEDQKPTDATADKKQEDLQVVAASDNLSEEKSIHNEIPEPGEPSQLDRLLERMDALQQEFVGKLKYDQKKDGIIDKLHRELQEYKNDLLLKLLRPFVLDVVRTMDDMARQVAHHRSKDELDPTKILRDLESFSGDLEDILYSQGVDTYETLEDSFDPKRQKVLRKVVTDNPDLDKTVARRVRKGYTWEGRILRPEIVDVYVYKKPELEPEKQEKAASEATEGELS